MTPLSRIGPYTSFLAILKSLMAKVFPLQAHRYAEKAGDPNLLVTQPYDKIPPDLQQRYYDASPYNFVRLTKGREEPSDNNDNNVYTRAAATLDAWIDEGILAQDEQPSFYAYFQEFVHPETKDVCVRKGFIGLTEALPYEDRVVHGHELTHSGPKLDRLQLTRHTKAHFGQLFVLYDDPEHAIDAHLEKAEEHSPLLFVEDESDVRHTLWKIDEPAAVAAIQASMESKKLLMADGHHRYETALAYAQENRDVPGADKVMMTFVNMRQEGLVVLATHRVLAGLDAFDPGTLLESASRLFEIEPFASSDELQVALRQAPATPSAIGLVMEGDTQSYLLTEKPDAVSAQLSGASEQERRLDVVVLHKALLGATMGISEEDVRELKNIRYVRGFDAAVDDVRSGGAQVAFLLRPVPVEQVAEVAFAGGVMPQKSTDFYPKLLSGLTIYRLG